MRKIIMTAAAFAVTMPVSMTFATGQAGAQTYRDRSYVRCKKHGGTTGAVLGGVGGALLGSAIGGTGATIAGAGAGALGGRAIERSDKKNKCKRYYR